jgi:hypothetical protein
MRNAGIQRIALHPKAIKRNVFRIAWRALKQQNPNGRQEKGSTHIDRTLYSRPLEGSKTAISLLKTIAGLDGRRRQFAIWSALAAGA